MRPKKKIGAKRTQERLTAALSAAYIFFMLVFGDVLAMSN
jgi:hypothetical protein